MQSVVAIRRPLFLLPLPQLSSLFFFLIHNSHLQLLKVLSSTIIKNEIDFFFIFVLSSIKPMIIMINGVKCFTLITIVILM